MQNRSGGVLCIALLVGACGSQKNKHSTTGGSSEGGSSAGSTGAISSPNDYLLSLPAWPAPSADANAATGAAATTFPTGADNLKYKCTSTPYSLTKTPENIFSFNPTADVLWPGALVQGQSYKAGTIEAFPITKRAPITVSIPTLLFAGNSEVVNNPSVATVEAAIGDIVGAAVTQGISASSSITYQQVTAYSTSQAELSLGLSAHYLGASVDVALDLSKSSDLHSVVGYFTENQFTVTVPQPSKPGEFFSADLTGDDLQAAVNNGQLGPTNLPVYVASVTYGRIMMFSITSRESTEAIQAALNAQYQGGVGGVAASAKYSQLMSDGSTTFKVVTVGGSAANAEEMILSGDPTSFFGHDPAISTAVPISYELRNLGNNSVAALSETTSYNVQTCVESDNGAGANVLVTDQGATQQKLWTFDAAGKGVTLTHPLTDSSGSNSFSGVTWQALNDRIYLSILVGHTGSVFAYEEDGTQVSFGGGAFAFGQDEYPVKLSYEPLTDRIVVVVQSILSPYTQQIKVFTSAGTLVSPVSFTVPTTNTGTGTLLTAAIQVPVNNYIYATVTDGLAGSTHSSVNVYKTNGTLVTTDGDWKIPNPAGGTTKVSPNGTDLAFDSEQNRIFMSGSYGDNAFYAFDLQGHLLATVSGLDFQANALAWDSVNQHLLVMLNDGSIIVYDADLHPVTLTPGAFSGIGVGVQIAFRP